MPFGLSTASCTFSRAMIHALGGLPFVVSYFDDVLIFSDSWNNHIKHVKTTLEALRKVNLTVRPSKTHIGFTTVNFLGHTISRGRIAPDEDKTTKIMQIKTPTTKKETRRLLGLLNYYRRFIKEFSKIAQPLTDLTKGKSPNKVKWTDECETSLSVLKQALTEPPILNIPDLEKHFVLQCDASDKAVGAALLQERDGMLLPCFYASRKLLERETHYCIAEKELVGLVFGLKAFSRFLLMKPFIIQTDHKPLTFLKQNASKNARLTRMALCIQDFTFSIEHLRGTQNVLCDFLSRSYT